MTPDDLIVGKLYQVQAAISVHYQKYYLYLGRITTIDRTIPLKIFKFLTPTGYIAELPYSMCAYYLRLKLDSLPQKN